MAKQNPCPAGCACGRHNRPKRTPEEEAQANRENRRKAYAANRDKENAASRRYQAAHREEIRARARAGSFANSLKYVHGMLPEDRAAAWASQQGACYLCGDPLRDGTRQVHIDHDHTHCPQGKSCAICRRGLACHRCNLLIGLAKDDSDLLRRIADRLETASAGVAARKAAVPFQGELPLDIKRAARQQAARETPVLHGTESAAVAPGAGSRQ